MSTEENKALACREIEGICTKGNFAAAKGTGRSDVGVDPAGRYSKWRRDDETAAHPLGDRCFAIGVLGFGLRWNQLAIGQDQNSDQIQSEHLSTVGAKDFERTNFDHSTQVDNNWFPLKPGEHSVFEGSAIDDGQRISRRVVTTVTDLSKEINGVNSIVVWERDYNEGRLVEAELGFFAQDNYGNVWHMGEYPEEYEEGEFDKAPGWLAGFKGASAGIAMRAEPRLKTPGYAQGYAPPPINWIDRGRVYKVGQTTCVPVGCYEDVLVIEEFERNKPGAYQLKYYAPGVGDVRVGWRGPEEEEKEGLDLVKDISLGPQALAKARADALKLEEHAYEIKEYYRKTQPAKPTL